MRRVRNYFILVLMLVSLAFASTSGPNFPTTATGSTNTIFGGGPSTWGTPTNIEANDAVFTTNTTNNLNTTDDLIGEGFGFSIPAGATINGILLEVNWKCNHAGASLESGVKLLKAGAAAGTDHSSGVCSTTATTISHGSSVDLWGTTWTPSDINNSTFGAALQYNNQEATGTVNFSVDFMRITVTFTPAATGCKSCMLNVFSENRLQTQTRTFGRGL